MTAAQEAALRFAVHFIGDGAATYVSALSPEELEELLAEAEAEWDSRCEEARRIGQEGESDLPACLIWCLIQRLRRR